MAKRTTTPTQALDVAGRLQRPHRGGALRLGGRGGPGDSESARRGHRALPVEQHEAGQRRRAGDAHAGAGSAGGSGTGRPGGQQQRLQHVRGDGPGRQAAESADARSAHLPAEAAVEMATIRGARALGMEKEIGSLESGKRADLISIRLDRPNAVPLYDVYSQMVYALKGEDVRRRDGERQAAGARCAVVDAGCGAD